MRIVDAVHGSNYPDFQATETTSAQSIHFPTNHVPSKVPSMWFGMRASTARMCPGCPQLAKHEDLQLDHYQGFRD